MAAAFVARQDRDLESGGAEQLLGLGVLLKAVLDDNRTAGRIAQGSFKPAEHRGFVAFDVDFDHLRRRHEALGDELVTACGGDEHGPGVRGFGPRGEGGHARVADRPQMERKAGATVGKRDGAGLHFRRVPLPMQEQSRVLARVRLEGDDPQVGPQTPQRRAMKPEVGADIPDYRSSPRVRAKGGHDLGLVESITNYDGVDVSRRVQQEAATIPGFEFQSRAGTRVGEDPSQR